MPSAWPDRPGVLALADWRRRIGELYAGVRRGLPDDAVGAHSRWGRERDQLFGAHPESPLPPGQRQGVTIPRFPYDPGLAFTARVDTDVAPERHTLPVSTGEPIKFERVGLVRLPVGELEVFWLDSYEGGLFVPFQDATSGVTTYGGGRYLLDTAKGADLGTTSTGDLVLDFNFAYHPSCFHDTRWSCPLPPPANRLRGEIRAGERIADSTASQTA